MLSKDDQKRKSSNSSFFSFLLEFNYTFKWVDDGAYGYKNKETGEWNGLMGELLSQVKVSWESCSSRQKSHGRAFLPSKRHMEELLS